MKDKNIGCLLAEDHGKLCGILTDRDIALKVTGEEKDSLTTLVDEVMTRDPVRISVNGNLWHLVSLMRTQHVRRVPIVDCLDTIVGIVTMDDLIGFFANEMSELGKTVSERFPQRTA
jgi:CBS domain-containing protein